MIERKWRLLFTESFRPLIRNWSKMRIGAVAEVGDNFGERIREVFVIADAEAVVFHDDVAAEAGRFVIERDDGSAFLWRKDLIGNGIAAGGERFLRVAPGDGIDSLLNGRHV